MGTLANPDKTHVLALDGTLNVLHDCGVHAPTGQVMQRRWTVPPAQLARHAPMFEPEMTPGDRSAFQDAVREHERKTQGQ